MSSTLEFGRHGCSWLGLLSRWLSQAIDLSSSHQHLVFWVDLSHFPKANQIKTYHDETLISKKLLVACITQVPLVLQCKSGNNLGKCIFHQRAQGRGFGREVASRSVNLYSVWATLLFHSKLFFIAFYESMYWQSILISGSSSKMWCY